MSRDSKLDRLAQIAELKATLAKGEAAHARAESDALAMKIDKQQQDCKSMAAVTPDPVTARAHASWLRHCDTSLRNLRAEQALARAELQDKMDRARHEEGRRQALDKLRSQAS